MAERTRISVVIVTFNGRAFLDACLDAAIAQLCADDELILVDNGSRDDTVPHVRARYPSVRVVENERNLGFAEGCNVGVEAARGDVIVLLNNDAVPRPGWLEALVRALEPGQLTIACSVVHDREYPEVYALGTGGLSLIGHPIPGAHRDVSVPFYATGGSLAFWRKDFNPPFPRELFAYFEDALLSWHVRLSGGRVVRALDSHVDHLGSATASRMPSLRTYFYERNKVLLLLLVYEWRTLPRLLPLYAFDGLVRLFESCLQIGRGRTTLADERRRYRLIGRGLAWIALHPGWVGVTRRRVQRARRLTDASITPQLSGRIFDDLVPSRLHAFANRCALRYCRAVGLHCVESTAPRPPQWERRG